MAKPELGLLFLAFALVICFIHQFPERTLLSLKRQLFPLYVSKAFVGKNLLILQIDLKQTVERV